MGELVMIVAAPGNAKTTFALHLAWHVKRPVLYFSPDTPAHVIRSQCAAMVNGHSLPWVQAHINNGSQAFYSDTLEQHFQHVRWDFDPMPNKESLDRQLEAATVLWGDYPHLVIVDCLRNLDVRGEDDYSNQRHATELLAIMAQQTGSCFVVLHHTVGSEFVGNRPLTLASVEGKVVQHESMVLGLHRSFDGSLGVSVLKNRGGLASAAGDVCINLPMNLERMNIGG